MADPADILASIGCLSIVYPKFVQQEIARLTDQFVASVKAFQNPLASQGDLNLQTLISDVEDQSKGSVMGELGAAAVGLLSLYTSPELQSMAPGVLQPPSGNRIQDVTNLGQSIAGTAMLTMAMVPETPFAIAQRICETIVQLVQLKQSNLDCLRRHIIQIANVLTILINTRTNVTATVNTNLDTIFSLLSNAIAQFGLSRRVVANNITFDVNAFDRGRALVDQALALLAPALPSGFQSILAVENVLEATGALPPILTSDANSKLAQMVVPQLVHLIQAETAAIQAQSDAIKFQIQQLQVVVTNYRASPTAQGVRNLQLQTIGSIISKLTDVQTSVEAARSISSTKTTLPQLFGWSVKLSSVQALALRIRAQTLVEGAVDDAVSFTLKATYGTLIEAINAINSPHVSKGIDDVTDLVAACGGIARQGELIAERVGDIATNDAQLRTFQVLCATTAIKMGSRIDESALAGVELVAACQPMTLLSIVARATVDQLISSMEQLGFDRGRDLLVTGQFSEFLNSSVDNLSYLGAAISALTTALAGIDDTGLRRQVSSILDDMIGEKTNSLLSASDNMDFSSLRRTAAIKDDIATLQQNAATIQSILAFLQGLASSLNLNTASIDPANFAQFAGSIDYLAIGAGGRLTTDVATLSRPSAGTPVC